MRLPADEVVVEGVERLPGLEHDVVGDVDDVIDGPHAHAAEPILHPERRRADGQAFDDGGGEATAKVRVGDGDFDPGGRRRRAFRVRDIGFAKGKPQERRNFAGEAEDAEEVGAVRPGGDVEDDVAELFHKGAANWRIRGQDEDALVLLAEAQLFFAEDHTRGFDAADSVALELRGLACVAVDEDGALGGEGNLLAGGEVGSAADDGPLAFAGVDRGKTKAVGVGVRLDAKDFGDADEGRVPIAADRLPSLDLGDGVGDASREFFDGQIDIHELAEPGERKLHRDL